MFEGWENFEDFEESLVAGWKAGEHMEVARLILECYTSQVMLLATYIRRNIGAEEFLKLQNLICDIENEETITFKKM